MEMLRCMAAVISKRALCGGWPFVMQNLCRVAGGALSTEIRGNFCGKPRLAPG
jgi:hypothetical protein